MSFQENLSCPRMLNLVASIGGGVDFTSWIVVFFKSQSRHKFWMATPCIRLMRCASVSPNLPTLFDPFLIQIIMQTTKVEVEDLYYCIRPFHTLVAAHWHSRVTWELWGNLTFIFLAMWGPLSTWTICILSLQHQNPPLYVTLVQTMLL